jgi:hypothetical protein
MGPGRKIFKIKKIPLFPKDPQNLNTTGSLAKVRNN